jgi:uncharacterized membrane protein
LAEHGFENVEATVNPLSIATWSIPIAVISVLVGVWRDLSLDSKLAKMAKGGSKS